MKRLLGFLVLMLVAAASLWGYAPGRTDIPPGPRPDPTPPPHVHVR